MDLNRPSSPDPHDRRDPFSWRPPSSRDFPDPADAWVDPTEERARHGRRLLRCRVGFSALSLALLLAAMTMIGGLILLFRGFQMPLGMLLGIPHWDLIESTTIVWMSLFGVCLLWGRWPDRDWQRRSGLLLLMCLVDAVLWSLDHAVDLGLSDIKPGHEWFRRSLGTALGWSEFALIAGLAADMAAHLGEAQAVEFGRAARSLATTGAMVWGMYFYLRTNWTTPIWPLRERMFDRNSILLMLGWWVLASISLVQATVLTMLAGRACGRTLRRMAAEDRDHDLLSRPSEAGWDDFVRSGPERGA